MSSGKKISRQMGERGKSQYTIWPKTNVETNFLIKFVELNPKNTIL